MFRIRKEQMRELGKVKLSNARRAVIDSYRQQGLQVEEDPRTKDLLVTDKAGGRARISTQSDGVVAVTSGEGRTHHVKFDDRGRLAAIADPAGTQTHFEHDARNNLVAISRGPDNQHRFEFDENNKVTAIHFPDQTSARYRYDAAGNLIAAADRNRKVSRYEYSETGQLTSMIDWQGNVTSFAYSGPEVPTTVVLPNGTRREWIRDQGSAQWKLLINGVEHSVSGPSPQQKDAYQVTCADGAWARYVYKDNRIVEAVNPTGSVKFEYDDQGRILKETVDGRIVEYLRNEVGSLIGIVTPDGAKLIFRRDTEQRVKEIQDWNGGRFKIQYEPSGAVAKIEYPNEVTATFTSNALGLPESMRLDSPHSMQRLHTAHSIGEYSWTNDLRDRVTAMTCNGERFSYQYDAEGRLIGENDIVYQLDANGNRLSDPQGTSAFDGANQILTTGGRPFAHDARGNLVSGQCPKGQADFTYDGMDRLIAAKTAEGEVKYAYDAMGRRVRKQVGSTVTQYVWAGEQLLSETTSKDGVSTRRDYLHFPDLKLPLAMRVAGKIRYFHTGRRAELLCMTGPAGEVLWEARYSAFGQTQIVIARESQPWRLAGQYFDEETGLCYVMARYYNPDLGRFLTADPRGIEGGSLNFYTYCDGDPVNKIDPTGELAFLAIIAVVAIGAAIGALVSGGIEAYKQHKADPNKPLDWGSIAKEAGKGALVGAVGAGVGLLLAPVAGALGTGLIAVAAGGALVGGVSAGVEQCVDNALHDKPITQGLGAAMLVGAGIGAVTAGAGAIYANRVRRAAQAARELEEAAQRARQLAEAAEAERRAAQELAEAERRAALEAERRAVQQRATLLEELKKNGIKHDPDAIVRIERDAQGKIVFLEKGNSKAGLQHIVEGHADDFERRGIPREQIPDAVMDAVTKGKQVGLQGRPPGRPVYEVVINGKPQRIAVTTGNNGFIVGANPAD